MQKIAIGIAVLALIVSGFAITRDHGSGVAVGGTSYQKEAFYEGLFAGTRRQFEVDRDGEMSIGSAGTDVARLNFGTCYLAPSSATITASSTALVDCQATAAWSKNGKSALTGVQSGDTVQAVFSTSTSAYGLEIVGASASTTAAGYLVLEVANYTGGTYTWPVTGSATGTASYFVLD